MHDAADPNRVTARLRLASARRRVRAFIAEIGTLEGSDFPHDDAEEALAEIKTHFVDLLESMGGLEDAPLRTLKEMCLDVDLSSESYTPVLGFLLRSTNVRNGRLDTCLDRNLLPL